MGNEKRPVIYSITYNNDGFYYWRQKIDIEHRGMELSEFEL